MATRKRTKSINDIDAQLARIWMNAANSLIANENDNRGVKRFEKAQRIRDQYIENITGTKAFNNDVKRTGGVQGDYGNYLSKLKKGAWNRQYENYNTDKAKAASNG